MKSVKKNYIYSIVYQILLLFVPLVTVPYVSRVLGADSIGTYSFTYSIVSYFMIFAMLGINNYGNREIAKCRDDRAKTSEAFSNIYAIQFFASLIMLAAYLVYVSFFVSEYKEIAFIQTICLFSTFFDFNWFFFGLEEFKLTVVRNGIIKILTLFAIFTFVKNENDLLAYTIISAGGILLSQLALAPFLKKYIDFVKPTIREIKRHIKPCLVLFIPVISVSLYNIMDKTMLGLMSDMTEVGYYTQTEKIVNVPLTFIIALSAVMMPRISNLVAKADRKKIMEYLDKAIIFMSLAAVPISLGLIIIAPDFIPIFLGPGYEKCSTILALLGITLIFRAIGSVFRSQYMTPHQMDREYAITTIIGAIVNLGINAILIPYLQSVGACIGTIAAEFSVLVYMAYVLRKDLPLKKYASFVFSNLWKGAIMFVVVYPINYIDGINGYVKILVEVLTGVAIYGVLSCRTLMPFLRRNK